MAPTLDAPRHRWPDRRDIAGLALEEVVRPGVRVDVEKSEHGERIGLSRLVLPSDLSGMAV